MRRSALSLQLLIRRFIARHRLQALRNRKLHGPPVVEMLKKTCIIDGLTFQLTIYRCGQNYRLEGLDLIRNVCYEGLVCAEEVENLLKEYNASLLLSKKHSTEMQTLRYKAQVGLTGTALTTAQIQPWQYEKVADLLSTQLGFIQKTSVVSNSLRNSGSLYDVGAKSTETSLTLVADPFARPSSVRGLQERQHRLELLSCTNYYLQKPTLVADKTLFDISQKRSAKYLASTSVSDPIIKTDKLISDLCGGKERSNTSINDERSAMKGSQRYSSITGVKKTFPGFMIRSESFLTAQQLAVAQNQHLRHKQKNSYVKLLLDHHC